MKILHIISVTNPKGNGVAEAVKKYLKYESEHNDVALYNLNTLIKPDKINEYAYKEYKSIEDLPNGFSNPDIVIFNEIYKPLYIKLYKECVQNKIKYIIIPHGSLVKEVQEKNKIKKSIANIVFFKRFIKKASAIQFLNDNEMENCNFTYKKAIICGNGIEKPAKYSNKLNKKNFVFIGRYDVKVKGLDLLCDTCSKYYDWFKQNRISIDLYGRDSSNNLVILKEMINDKKIGDIIKIHNAVYGADKKEILINAYGFIQCSRHEGQPMGILEALSIGVPCLVTFNTSFGNYVNKNECGIGFNFDINELFNAIQRICSSNSLREKYSLNARNKSIEDYEWHKVIAKTIKEYEEI